jgi:hypothetical protein
MYHHMKEASMISLNVGKMLPAPHKSFYVRSQFLRLRSLQLSYFYAFCEFITPRLLFRYNCAILTLRALSLMMLLPKQTARFAEWWGIFPDVYQPFDPRVNLVVKYPNATVYRGNRLTPTQVRAFFFYCLTKTDLSHYPCLYVDC